MATEPREGRVGRIALAAAGTLVVVEHLVSLAGCPNPRYGGGAEYIEHLRRARTWEIVRHGEGFAALVSHLDRSEYPPGLMLAQLPFDLAFGPGLATTVMTQLLWLALLVAATVAAGRALGLGRAAPWAGTLVLLAPGAWSTARLFYYDLPAAAALTVALAAWLQGTRRPAWSTFAVASAAVLAAELIRWEAVLAAAPLAVAAAAAAAVANGSRGRRARAVALIAASCGAAAAGAFVWVRAFPVSAGMRIGQLREINHLDGHAGGDGMASAFSGRFGSLTEDALRFYPTTLSESVWGAALVVASVAALITIRRHPRPVLALTATAAIGVPAALLAVTDIQESRFVLPLLPVLALGTTAGLLELPARLREPVLFGVAALAAVQLLAFEHTAIDAPRGLVPAALYGSIRSDRPSDRECTDVEAARTALATAPDEAETFALDPANRSLGSTPHVWDYVAIVSGARLRRTGDAGADVRIVDDDPDAPGARVPFRRHDDPDRPGVLVLVTAP